jgi:hypothetical protein
MVRRVSPMERKILLFIEGATAVGVRGEKRSKTSGRDPFFSQLVPFCRDFLIVERRQIARFTGLTVAWQVKFHRPS